MRVLVITKIFPNASEPEYAPYNRHQFAALGELCSVEVLGLIPWFPAARWLRRSSSRRGRPAVPWRETISGLQVSHPRVFYLPRIGRAVSGLTYAVSLLPWVVPRRGTVDVVLGSFAYPDGWAAVMLARLLGVPAVLKLHGSDINVLSEAPILRPHLRWALSHAAAVVAPSQALVDRAVELGACPEHATLVANGVNTELFYLRDRAESRQQLGIAPAGKWILFVGRLEPQKGVGELLDALAVVTRERPDVRLALVGDGVARAEYEARVARDRLPVSFVGSCSHEAVAQWVGACDLLALPSWAEGTPNVVLEALVSGRRVVASAVGGIPAVVDRPLLGELVPARDASELAGALARALDAHYAPQEVVAGACVGGWNTSAEVLHQVLTSVLSARGER